MISLVLYPLLFEEQRQRLQENNVVSFRRVAFRKRLYDTVEMLQADLDAWMLTYNEARTLGENFRDGVPVIMNLGEMDDGDATRLVDFSAGLILHMEDG